MAFLKIREIKTNMRPFMLRARVCRVWGTKPYSSAHYLTSFDAILIDEQNDAIQATMLAEDADHFGAILEMGKTYTFSNFYVQSSRTSGKIVPHDYMLRFTTRVSIKEFAGDTSKFPLHRFYIIDYSNLRPRMDKNFPELTDIIGRIKKVERIERKSCDGGQRTEDMRNVIIENTRREELTVSLWGDAARRLDQQTISEHVTACIIIFTSIRVGEFRYEIGLNSTPSTQFFIDPQIPDAEIYYKAFVGPQFAPHVDNTTDNFAPLAHQLMEQNRTTLLQLQEMEPDQNRNRVFTCEAKVKSLNFYRTWYYEGCSKCTGGFRFNNNTECQRRCQTSAGPTPWFKFSCKVQDDTEDAVVHMIGQPPENVLDVSASTLVKDRRRNPRILPPELYELINKTFIFQVKWGSQKRDNSRSDLTVTAVYDPKKIADRLQTEAAIAGSSQTAAQGSPSSSMLMDTPSRLPYTPMSPLPSIPITPPSTTPTINIDRTLLNEESQAKKALAFPLDATIEGLPSSTSETPPAEGYGRPGKRPKYSPADTTNYSFPEDL